MPTRDRDLAAEVTAIRLVLERLTSTLAALAGEHAPTILERLAESAAAGAPAAAPGDAEAEAFRELVLARIDAIVGKAVAVAQVRLGRGEMPDPPVGT